VRLSLRGRLALLFLALFATIIALGLASVWSLRHSNEVAMDVRDRWLPAVRLLGDLNTFTSDDRTAEANSLLAGNAQDLADSLRETGLLDRSVAQAQQDYERLRRNAEEAALYQQFAVTWAAYKSLAGKVGALAADGHGDQAVALYRTRSRETYDAASNLLGRLTASNVALAAAASERSAAAYDQARWLMAAALAAAGAMLAFVVAQVRRQISVPLRDLGHSMRRLAANDTGVEIGHTARGDEIGEMARAVVVFRANAIELVQSQRGLAQQASMLEERLAAEQSVAEMQRNFLAVITHEFRTPLTQIDAHAQRLVNLKDRLQPGDIAGRAGRIRAAVARIVRLIDQLVDTTRLMDGDTGLFFHPEPIDLAAVLREVCRVQRDISPDALMLEAYGAESLPVQGDPKLLFQAFGNLVSNAVKYSEGRPRVAVRARRAGDSVTVTVEDSGIGIPEQDRARLFARYFRGSNVSGFVGTGIGLFLVSMVVRLHEGTVDLVSEVGKGSAFTVTLPADAGRG
jgi:signal transduction histidine kinase